MIHHLTFAMPLPQTKPAALLTSCFQFHSVLLRKSLKNKDLPPPPFIFTR